MYKTPEREKQKSRGTHWQRLARGCRGLWGSFGCPLGDFKIPPERQNAAWRMQFDYWHASLLASFAAMASMGIDVDLELSVCTFGAASQHHMATYEIAMRFSPQNVMRGGRDSSGMRAGNRGDRGDVRWSQDGP